MAKCDLAKFKQPAVTFCLLVKIVRPHQCQLQSTIWLYVPGLQRIYLSEHTIAIHKVIYITCYLHDVRKIHQ